MRILKHALGRKIDLGGEEHSGWLPANSALPQRTPVEQVLVDVRIFQTDGGFILEWEYRNSDFTDDSWHTTIGDAENQAEIEFGIRASDWQAPNAVT